MVANTVFVKNSNYCQTKRPFLIGSIIGCMTLFLISSVVVSSADASSRGNNLGLGDAVNPQTPDVKPSDTGSAEFKCDQFKCTCKGVIDCFNMGAANVCSDNLAPQGKGVYTCTHKS